MTRPALVDGELSYRVALVAVAAIQGILSRRYMMRAKASATLFQKRAEGRSLTVATGTSYAAYCLAVLVYMMNPAWMAWSAVPLPPWLRWVGALVMAAGAALHIWGMHHLGTNLTISISTREGHSLVTTGPFRWVRHPLYAGGIMESIGVCLLLANGAVAISALAFWLLIAWRTPLEEARLREVFGDAYSQYCARVARYFPKVRP